MEKAKTFEDVFNSKIPVINSDSYNKKQMFTFIANKCKAFLEVNSTTSNNDDIAFQFAEDIIDTRLDWKPLDIDLFFKTVRQRQDIEEFKVLGNKISGFKLAEMIVAYEDLRAYNFEVYNKKKWSVPEVEKTNIDVKKYTEPILARLKSPSMEYVKPEGTDLAQSFIKDFDKIYNGQAKSGTSGIRTIEIENTIMNIDDYLIYRMKTKHKS